MTEQRDVDRKREQVRQSLNEIEARLNPTKIAKQTVADVRDAIDRDPAPWVAAAAGVVVLVAGSIALSIFGKRR